MSFPECRNAKNIENNLPNTASNKTLIEIREVKDKLTSIRRRMMEHMMNIRLLLDYRRSKEKKRKTSSNMEKNDGEGNGRHQEADGEQGDVEDLNTDFKHCQMWRG